MKFEKRKERKLKKMSETPTTDNNNNNHNSNNKRKINEFDSEINKNNDLNDNNENNLNDIANGHHFGNFHQYYDFHNPVARYSIILEGTFKKIWERLNSPQKFYILDIGCNEGNLTIEILQLARVQLPNIECIAIGIDIDDKLIKRAQNKYQDIQGVTFITANCLSENVIINIMKLYSIEKFSLVTAFSITMWIHMNHGDDGLIQFLQIMGEITNGGILIEPQKWISYRKAIQRCRRMKINELPHYQNLQIRDIELYSQEYYTNNHQMELLWRIPCEEWGREAVLFIKTIES